MALASGTSLVWVQPLVFMWCTNKTNIIINSMAVVLLHRMSQHLMIHLSCICDEVLWLRMRLWYFWDKATVHTCRITHDLRLYTIDVITEWRSPWLLVLRWPGGINDWLIWAITNNTTLISVSKELLGKLCLLLLILILILVKILLFLWLCLLHRLWGYI